MADMYPFHENAAGIFRSTHTTSKPSEALLAGDEIISLAKELLSEDVYRQAESLSQMLVGSKSKINLAKNTLKQVLLPPPKRPIFYLTHELGFLPHWTREALRFLGDFIDMLTKAAVFEKESKTDIFRLSFGPAIKRFGIYYPQEKQLVDWLERYNRFLYRDAKHDFKLPVGRKEHRFTSREVVLTIFITKELADRITVLSATASRVRQDKPM